MSEGAGFTTMASDKAAGDIPEVGVGMLGYAFMGKAHAAFLAVDLQRQRILAPGGEARRLQRADRAVLELHGRGECVVHSHLA